MKGWLVEEATHVPAKPLAWFHGDDEVEARRYAARRNAVVREMNGAVQLVPAPPVGEVLR